jgi:hypothetical protein
MGLLYGRAGRLTALSVDFRPGQVRAKVGALQAAVDCGALSQSDFERAKKRLLKGVAGGASGRDSSSSDGSDGEGVDTEAAKLRAMSFKGRRTANPWAQNPDFIPAMTGPADGGEGSAVEVASPSEKVDASEQAGQESPHDHHLEDEKLLHIAAANTVARGSVRRSMHIGETETKSSDSAISAPASVTPTLERAEVLAVPKPAAGRPGDGRPMALQDGNLSKSAERQQISTLEEQQRRDEQAWEQEAQRWLLQQEERKQVLGTAAERGPTTSVNRPKLRYLCRQPVEPSDLQFPAIAPASATAAPPPPPAEPGASVQLPELPFAAAMEERDESDPHPGPAAVPGRIAAYTLMVTCDDPTVLRGAHKIRLLNDAVEVFDVPTFSRAVLGVLGRQGVVVCPLAELLRSSGEFTVQYIDPEFDEYIVLSALTELPERTKIKLCRREFRPGSAQESAQESVGDPVEELSAPLRSEASALSAVGVARRKRPPEGKPKPKTASLAELRAARNRLLQADPGMAFTAGLRHMTASGSASASGPPDNPTAGQTVSQSTGGPDGDEAGALRLAEAAMGGALAAIESFEAGRHRKEKNMLMKLSGGGSFRTGSSFRDKQQPQSSRPSSAKQMAPSALSSSSMPSAGQASAGELRSSTFAAGTQGEHGSPSANFGGLRSRLGLDSQSALLRSEAPSDSIAEAPARRGEALAEQPKRRGRRRSFGEGDDNTGSDAASVASSQARSGASQASADDGASDAGTPEALPLFDGEWRAGRPWQGAGRWLSPEGHSFSGSWMGGRPHTGEGTCCPAMIGGSWRGGKAVKSTDGVFVGALRDGMPVDGHGEFVDEAGYRWKGRWQRGTGEGSVSRWSGAPWMPIEHDSSDDHPKMLCNFHGRWLAGAGPPHTGIGSWVDAEGCRCDGEWRDGELWTGSGKWRSPRTQIVFEGEWTDGSGVGTYARPRDGRVVPGSWQPGGMPDAEVAAAARAKISAADEILRRDDARANEDTRGGARAAALLNRTEKSRKAQREAMSDGNRTRYR